MPDYILQTVPTSLRLGVNVDRPVTATVSTAGADWTLPHQPLRAREIVEALDTLFEAVCLQLGPGIDRGPLLQSMAGTLAIAGREACLPLAALDFADPLRRELTGQAERIGRALAEWASQANGERVARGRFGEERLRGLALRSHCDGHLWTPAATALLTGRSGGPAVMQLYNEWLHQLVLLRDALLPFENWQEVPLPLERASGFRGLRGLEAARASFLAEFFTKILTQASIVNFARTLFEPDGKQEPDIYGFQTETGLVLPSVIGRSDLVTAPKGLLRWHPAQLAAPPSGRTLAFRYAFADYLSAPRSAIGATQHEWRESAEAKIVAEPAEGGELTLRLVLGTGLQAVSVDLGQCLRGVRFAYRPVARAAASARPEIVPHDLDAVFGQPGLVSAEGGIHLLPTGGDAMVTLALLGKIYPENTVVAGQAAWSDVLAAGKAYGAKFVLGSPT